MAIQIPNPGTGNGATGDNEFVLWTKVKDNFTDQTNAASKLVGTAANQLPLASSIFTALQKNRGEILSDGDLNNYRNINSLVDLRFTTLNKPFPETGSSRYAYIEGNSAVPNDIFGYQISYGVNNPSLHLRSRTSGTYSPWVAFYHTGNTTKDANGFIKAASPIVKVFADKVELNGDAESQNVTYKKNGIGDYTITTVSGLSTDGWYIELPKDMNGNPKVAVTLSEVDGVISLKTYKRIFSMETFTFVPDLDNPLDIPETRWIDLRLNEIPVDMPDDTQMEV